MDFLTNSIIAYNSFDEALNKIEDAIKDVKSNNVGYFYQKQQDDKYLSNYINSVMEMKKMVSKFNNLFDDFLMEIEVAEQQKWEYEQAIAEEIYYSEVYNEGNNE